MRFHTQTAGVSLTAQQPEVNIVRTALEALAAVLGGTQSLHTNSFDEALALPTEDAVRIALRTQQVIAHETGRREHDRPARRLVLRRGPDEPARGARPTSTSTGSTQLGGVVAAIKENFFQREIAEASFRYQSEVESGKRVIVGVNRYELEDEEPIEILQDRPGARAEADRAGAGATRATRDSRAVEAALARAEGGGRAARTST